MAMRQSQTMTVERVRGMSDVPPAVLAARQQLADRMLAVCARAGYAPMDFPVLESTELFLRKAGEERVQQMYAFRYRNRDLSLRPEFTASVVGASYRRCPVCRCRCASPIMARSFATNGPARRGIGNSPNSVWNCSARRPPPRTLK